MYPNIVNRHQGLETGRIDAAVDGFTTGVVAQQTGKVQGARSKFRCPIRGCHRWIPANPTFRKTNTALDTALDEDIAALRADGLIAAILKAHGLNPSAADPSPPKIL
jgi:polar amino acid transport system substrate-binding protein